MTGADTESALAGISENLEDCQMFVISKDISQRKQWMFEIDTVNEMVKRKSTKA